MWDRAIIKMNAKSALRGHWGVAIAVMLTVILFSGIVVLLYLPKFMAYDPTLLDTMDQDISWMAQFELISLLVGIFVIIPLIIGMVRFFVQNCFGNTQYANVFSGFQHGYGKSVGTMFVTGLFIGLWSLLFYIPGIIKSLEYSMVPFILSDNPYIDNSRARQISRLMTDGEKGDIFVLGLSFIGWYLIPAIAAPTVGCCLIPIVGTFSLIIGVVIYLIGMLMLGVYVYATYAQLYIFLRDRAIQSGMVHPAELNLMPPQEQQPQQPQYPQYPTM